MAKKRRGRPAGSGRGPGRPSKQETIDTAMDHAELQRLEIQAAVTIFLLFNNDAQIDQYALRKWVCYKAGLNPSLVLGGVKAQEPEPEPGGPEPVPEPEPEPAPVPEPEPEPVQA